MNTNSKEYNSKFRGENSIILCDNSNLAYKGQALGRYIASDKFILHPMAQLYLLQTFVTVLVKPSTCLQIAPRVDLVMEEGVSPEALVADAAMDVDANIRFFNTIFSTYIARHKLIYTFSYLLSVLSSFFR